MAQHAETTTIPLAALMSLLNDISWGEAGANHGTPLGMLANVLFNVVGERMKQDQKWGPQDHHPVRWIAIIAEELGKAAKNAVELDWKSTGGDSEQFHAISDVREELVRVAAVAVAAIEAIDRGNLDAWYRRETLENDDQGTS